MQLSLKTHTELKDQICNLQNEVDTRLVAAQHQMKAVAEQQQQAPAAVAAAPLETTAAVAEKELSDIKVSLPVCVGFYAVKVALVTLVTTNLIT